MGHLWHAALHSARCVGPKVAARVQRCGARAARAPDLHVQAACVNPEVVRDDQHVQGDACAQLNGHRGRRTPVRAAPRRSAHASTTPHGMGGAPLTLRASPTKESVMNSSARDGPRSPTAPPWSWALEPIHGALSRRTASRSSRRGCALVRLSSEDSCRISRPAQLHERRRWHQRAAAEGCTPPAAPPGATQISLSAAPCPALHGC